MLMTDIITKKRDNKELTKEEIEFFVCGATDGSIPDYQLSALLMAICINGMNDDETSCLTLAMAKSGDMLDLSLLGDKTVDKHSTGGVGDKTTLVCGPIAAALGCTVAKMSGRGLGHTGGTADKLEAINGYNTVVSKEAFISIAKNCGLCLVGHSGNFAPADKKLYSLRDVTSTVESIPLIASSIMSKKIAAGAENIVLDVKFGSGAFMKTPDKACLLAEKMVKIGNLLNRKTVAVITDMDIPLGRNIGNALEVEEALEILKGKGDKRLFELCIALAANMYCTCFGADYEEALNKARAAVFDGSALNKLCESVKALGGDTEYLTGEKPLQGAEASVYLKAEDRGFISEIDSFKVGKAANLSSAGRETLKDKIDPFAGIVLLKQYGEFAEKGEAIAEIRGKKERLPEALACLNEAFSFSDTKPQARPLVYKIIKEVE